MVRIAEIRKIALVGDYLPRKCGIATFTTDLCRAVAGHYSSVDCTVGAVMVAEKEFERSGFLPDIVFPTGLVRREDHLLVYYGAADTATWVAQYSLSDWSGSVT